MVTTTKTSFWQESQQLPSVFTGLICFSVSPTGWFEVGGALLDKGDVTYVAAPIRFKQRFNQNIVMFVVAGPQLINSGQNAPTQ